MATRRKSTKPTFEKPVAEYVDSSLMTQRLRSGMEVSARITGNFGAYRTVVSRSKKLSGACTCPSEIRPCKHVHALRATWDANAESFFDLDDWLLTLTARSKTELIEAIELLVKRSPESLGLFGIAEFEEDEEEDADDYF